MSVVKNHYISAESYDVILAHEYRLIGITYADQLENFFFPGRTRP